MSDYVITGRVFSEDDDGEVTPRRQRIRQIARSHGIGANFNSDLVVISTEKNCLTFEITDEETQIEFNRINGNIWYAEYPWKIADLSQSGFPEIQAFLVEVSEQPWVAHIEVDIDNAHGYPGDHSEMTIEAKDFCKAIIEAPLDGGMLPLVNLKILRAGL